MILSTFDVIKPSPIDLSKINLSTLHCGLFRCPLDSAAILLPELEELFESVPVDDPKQYEIDVKIHMLMKDQYPCIPNWHCDNVPRDRDGKLDYGSVDLDNPKMLLWVSDEPTTEFLLHNTNIGRVLKDHGEIAPIIANYNLETRRIPTQTWISMDQLTPHRGTKALGHTWRIFARVTHKSMAPQRPVDSMIRRHSQVYLDASTFTW